MNQNTLGEAATERPVFLTRVMDAPRDLVWRAWSQAEALSQWWGPAGFSTRVEQFDFQPGGTFLYTMQTPGGECCGKLVYQDIVPPERLVFVLSFCGAEGNIIRAPFSDAHPLEILSEVLFFEQNGKTTIEMRGGPLNLSQAEREAYAAVLGDMQHGTNATLDNLAIFLARA